MTAEKSHDRTDDSPLDAVVAEMTQQTVSGTNVEQETASMMGAILLEYDAETYLGKGAPKPITDFLGGVAQDTLVARNIKAPAAISLLRTGMINYFTRYAQESGREFSDAGMRSVDDWIPPIQEFREDLLRRDSDVSQTMALHALHYSLMARNASTPRRSRYVPDELLAQLLYERYPEGARGLDIGSSIMAGALQIMHKRQFSSGFGFGRVEVERPHPKNPSRLTAKSNSIVRRSTAFGEIICNDTLGVYDEEAQKYDDGNANFALSGLRPSERNDPTYFGTVKSLMDKKQKGSWNYTPNSGVTFHQGDLLDPADLEAFKAQSPEPFDFIILNFVTQELPLESQHQMHAVVNQLVKENGIIAYIHQAYVKGAIPGKPSPITDVEHYDTYATVPFRSQLHVTDKLNPYNPDGVQQVMTFFDNRCAYARVGQGQLVVNGKLEPIEDLIRHG